MARGADTEIVRRLHAGDDSAFADLDTRHRRALTAYARRLLRSEHDAQDVVQDALVSAHTALRAGSPVRELRPWLYALVRNRAIDEVRRARHGEQELPTDAGDAGAGDPVTVLFRRESVRRLVEDIAELPDEQRTALLMREVDGAPAEEVAAHLGLSSGAAQMLVARARGNLVRARDARDADCGDVRMQLALAHERGVRAAEHALRHSRECPGCKGYRRDLRRVDRRLRVLAPPAWIVPAVLAAKLGGGSATKAAAGGALAAIALAGAGIAILDRDVVREGDPAPLRLLGAGNATGGRVGLGAPLPSGVSVAFARFEIPAGRPQEPGTRTLRLTCPGGTVAVGLARPERELPVRYQLDRPLTGRTTRTVVVEFEDTALREDVRTRLGLVCKQPDATGSTVANPRRPQPGERAGRICADQENVLRSPGRTYQGSVGRGEPVSVVRESASGQWVRVVTEFRLKGWIRASALCDDP
jgi:RNA polymerase sigma factor (sigma-70 family)